MRLNIPRLQLAGSTPGKKIQLTLFEKVGVYHYYSNLVSFPEPRESRVIPYEWTCNPSARWYCFPSNVIILETAKKIHLSKCHHLVRRRLLSSTASTLTAAAFALALAEALPRGV